ncbi:hypothetical protein DSM104299_04475 [Baekduia alba]|uniref:FG-GAP repeat domain-containing protein n=1 Tax=Baekduia alba TaxID=2997333 RepID=UPI00233F7EC7|nr:VCBS repeat-containing protein [Baekduia alba]WCB95726.1 hypothetical protein DSM104299_04475 [Baekduia alba]
MRARPRRRRLAVAAAAAALTAGAGGAAGGFAPAALANDAGSVTHAAGAVSATLEWAAADGAGVADPRLSVVRDGTRYDLAIADICGEGCILVPDDPGAAASSSIVKVADLDGDGEPEVLVDTYSGGAHCCLTARVLTWDGTGYQPTDVAYGDVGYALEDANGDGRPELVGQDPVFSYAFTAFADSAFPVQVLQVDHGKVVDATGKFPKLVRADAGKLLKALRKARRGDDIRGVLAAYVADQYTLGRVATAHAEIAHQLRAGRVSKSFGPLLLKRLKAWHYR